MKSCFVIMPIGDQEYEGVRVTAQELRQRYTDLISEAIKKADPEIDVTRADDVSTPGSITTDIFARLMHSTYVIADISFPNPNVFYELGIRHAISNRTILIRDRVTQRTYFDISHLRYIEYENSPSGIKTLAAKLQESLDAMTKNPNSPDNQFMEFAALTHFLYPKFSDPEEELRKKRQARLDSLVPVFANPDLFKIMMDPNISQETKNAKATEILLQHPESLPKVFESWIMSGLFDRFEDSIE